MQKDFHFDMVYILARATGFDQEMAYDIARSSQYVDDDKGDISLDQYQDSDKIITSYDAIHPRNFVFEEGFDVWIPFHFLPGGKGDNLPQRLVCQPADANPNADSVLAFFQERASEIFNAQLLGIILHVIGDTYSHQGFNGVLSDQNNIMDVNPELDKIWQKVPKTKICTIILQLLRLLKIFTIDTFRVGHAEAEYRPDIPWLEWSYRHEKYKKDSGLIKNIERTQAALSKIYDILLEAASNVKDRKDSKPQPKDSLIRTLSAMISEKPDRDPQKRHSYWIRMINGNHFDFIPENNVEYYEEFYPPGHEEPEHTKLKQWHKAAKQYLDFVHTKILDPILIAGW